jgi:hypothetical protein
MSAPELSFGEGDLLIFMSRPRRFSDMLSHLCIEHGYDLLATTEGPDKVKASSRLTLTGVKTL